MVPPDTLERRIRKYKQDLTATKKQAVHQLDYKPMDFPDEDGNIETIPVVSGSHEVIFDNIDLERVNAARKELLFIYDQYMIQRARVLAGRALGHSWLRIGLHELFYLHPKWHLPDYGREE
jgi:hypothetical protein